MSYNLVDLRTRVRRKLKDNSYNQSDIDMFLNDAQTEIAGLFHWPFFQKLVSGTLTVDEYTFEQQADHQITTSLILIHPTTTTSYVNITKNYMPSQEFFEQFPAPDTQESARPYYWTEYGDQIYFDRPSDLAYILRQFYYRLPTDMVADADVPDLPVDFREALVLGATYRAEEQRDNYDFASVIQNKFNDKVSDLIDRYAVVQLATAEHSTLSGKISVSGHSEM